MVSVPNRQAANIGVSGHCCGAQVAYLLVYGHLPLPKELARWEEAVMRHSAVPVTVVRWRAMCKHKQWPDGCHSHFHDCVMQSHK